MSVAGGTCKGDYGIFLVCFCRRLAGEHVPEFNVFSVSDPRIVKRLQRCLSDPAMTFKKIEAKVLLRSATKRVQKRASTVSTATAAAAARENTVFAVTSSSVFKVRSSQRRRGQNFSGNFPQKSGQKLCTSGQFLTPSFTEQPLDESSPICHSNLSLNKCNLSLEFVNE